MAKIRSKRLQKSIGEDEWFVVDYSWVYMNIVGSQ